MDLSQNREPILTDKDSLYMFLTFIYAKTEWIVDVESFILR